LGQGEGWFQFQTDSPIDTNPLVVQALVNKNIPVVGLSEVSRSLEKVYLQAFSSIQSNGKPQGMAQNEASGDENQHAG